MPKPPNLLNDDGSASIATALLMSHHGFRRDIARFAMALEKVAKGDGSRAGALREEWQRYRDTLHGHHQSEDAHIFPQVRSEHESLGPTIEGLVADHRRIDPLLERGERAFAELPKTEAAVAIVAELTALLDSHLATEEAEVVPHLREMKEFPPPANDAELELYAQGFAWSFQGIAPEVLNKVHAMLPDNLKSRLPAARAAFDARCARVWGGSSTGASHTAIPDGQ